MSRSELQELSWGNYTSNIASSFRIRALAPWGSNLRPRPPGWYGRSGAKTENRVKTDGDISLFRIDTKRTETSRKAQEQRDKGSRCVFASKIMYWQMEIYLSSIILNWYQSPSCSNISLDWIWSISLVRIPLGYMHVLQPLLIVVHSRKCANHRF